MQKQFCFNDARHNNNKKGRNLINMTRKDLYILNS